MSNEINRILKQFADLQHGESWIGNNFKQVLHGITAATASRAFNEDTNSIWSLIAHLIYWRTTVANRLGGTNDKPTFQDFHLPEEMSDENWKQTLIDFEASYHILRNSLLHLKPENIDKPSPVERQSFYDVIIGCLQHDAYHLGQIALLKK